jgi:hypothetical protein
MTGFDPEQWLSLQTLAIFIKSLAFSSHFLALLAKKLPEYPGREELNYTNLLAITEVSGKIASHFRNPAILSSIEFDHNENDDEGDGDLKDDGGVEDESDGDLEVDGGLEEEGDGDFEAQADNKAEEQADNNAEADDYEQSNEYYIDVDALLETVASMMDSDFNLTYHGISNIVCDLVFVLESISPQLNEQEKRQLNQHLHRYLRSFFLQRKTTALHVIVAEITTEEARVETTEKLSLIKKFLHLGADPNAIDEKGQTPLHILVERESAYLDVNLINYVNLNLVLFD